MDELRSYFYYEDTVITPATHQYRVYHADKVDKIIKEKDKELFRQKYKRCLKIAKWCFTKANYHFYLARSGEDSKENLRKDALYTKWRKRWLELAESLKEN